MYNSSYIELAFQEKFEVRKEWKSSYLFKPRGWLDRLAWRYLQWRKTLTLDWTDTVTFKRIVIDKEKAVRLIIDTAEYKIAEQYNKKITKVYMGPEWFSQLMADPIMVHSSCNFNLETPNYRDWTYRNIPIEVIPWMNGILVV